MAKQEKYYWHGKGAILIGTQTYAKGEEIPADKIEKKRLKEYMDKGAISTAEVEVQAGASETVLQAQHKELKAAHTKLLNEHEKLKESKGSGKCTACPAKDKEIEALKKTGDEAVTRIEELEADVKKKAELIEKLEKDLEDATAPGPDAGGAGPGGK